MTAAGTGATPRRGLRHWRGLAATAVAVAFWAVLAARTPTNTYHLAPAVVAAAWVVVEGHTRAGLVPRRVVQLAAGGLAIAVGVIVVLHLDGDLEGPVLWRHGPGAPVVSEHLLFAVAGALGGAASAWRAARRAPE